MWSFDVFGIISMKKENIQLIGKIKKYCLAKSYIAEEIKGPWYRIIQFDRLGRMEAQKSTISTKILIGNPIIHSPFSRNSTDGHYLSIECMEAKNNVVIKTDLVGSVNLYYSIWDNSFLFSTSSMLLSAFLPSVSIDYCGVLEFLNIGYLLNDNTFYKEIKVVRPATEWLFTQDNLPKGENRQWWFPPSRKETTEKDIDQYSSLMSEKLSVIAKEIASIHPKPICDLTGGYDSRGVLSSFIDSKIPFANVVNGLPSTPDVKIACSISEALNLDLIFNNNHDLMNDITLTAIDDTIMLTDGEIDIVEYVLTGMIQKRTAGQGGVSINGSGGELFRGYWWEGEFPFEGRKKSVNINYLLNRLIDSNFAWDIHGIEAKNLLIENVRKTLHEIFAEVSDYENTRKIDYLYLKLRMGRWYARYYSSTIKILPCFSPFLFQPMMDLAFKIPPYLKRRKKYYKHWLLSINPKLAWLPTEDGSPAAPFKLSKAKKFLPLLEHYTQKIKKRIVKESGIKRHKQPMGIQSKILSICDYEYNLLDLLQPRSMETGAIYDSKVFLEMIDRDKKCNYVGHNKQLTKVLTLELAFLEQKKLRELFSR